MDKNTLYGLILIFLILVGFSWFGRGKADENSKVAQLQDSIAKIEAEQNAIYQRQLAEAESGRVIKSTDTLFLQEGLEDEIYFLENNLVKIGISTRGGRVAYVELKEYVTSDSMPLILWYPEHSQFGLHFENMREEINTNRLLFSTDAEEIIAVAESEPRSIDMTLTAGEDKYLRFSYTLAPDSYALQFNIITQNMGRVIPGSLSLKWNLDMPQLEKSAEFETRYTGLFYKMVGSSVDKLGMSSKSSEDLSAKTKWIAFKQQFFSSILIAETEFNPAAISIEKIDESGFLKNANAEIPLSYNGEQYTEFQTTFLFLPNNYYTLREYGKDINLQDLVNLGWKWLAWINRYIVIPIFSFLETYVTKNYGLIILLLTLIIKLVLWPLTQKSYKSSAKMRLLKPQIDAINEKIPAEKSMERQQATMDLYRKAGVNPMGGCLPMLLSFPLLIALFWFFPGAIELRQQKFLWATDLASYDSILNLPFNIPFYGNHVSLFCLLMTAVNIIYTWMNAKTQPQNDQMKAMRYTMYLMPVMFLFIFNNYSAALSYYYFVSTLISVVMTWVMRRFVISDEKILLEMAEAQKKPAKKSSFQQRLAQMQKEQEKKLREQRAKNGRR